MSDLMFCRDGVLRAQKRIGQNDDETSKWAYVPVSVMEKTLDVDVFLPSLQEPFVFEDGLTLGEFMENLAPWASLVSALAQMNFPAYLEEARRGDGTGCEEVSHILIENLISIDARSAYERDGEHMFVKREDGFYQIGLGKPLFTGKVRMENYWDMSAVLKEERRAEYDGSKSISLSLTPVSEYAHIPLIVKTETDMLDDTGFRPEFLGTSLGLFNTEHPNVISRDERKIGNTAIRLDAYPPNVFEALICGLLREIGFNYSPVLREEQKASLDASIRSLDQGVSEDQEKEQASLYKSQKEAQNHRNDAAMAKVIAATESAGLSVKETVPQKL